MKTADHKLIHMNWIVSLYWKLMSFIKVNSRKILHAFQNIREIIEWFYFVPSLSQVSAPGGLFKNGGDNITFGRVWAVWQVLFDLFRTSFLTYLNTWKKSPKSYCDSIAGSEKRSISTSLLFNFVSVWCENIQPTMCLDFSRVTFWILLVIMFYSEILSYIFAPCLVYGFIIALNVCPSLFWIHF